MTPSPDSQGNLSLETLKRLDAVCASYERAWRKDQPPRFDDFLGGAVEPERGLIFRELLKLDAELRGKAGIALATGELRERFPEYSDLITSLESQSIATDATMPPREADRLPESKDSGSQAGSQTIDTDAHYGSGVEDLPSWPSRCWGRSSRPTPRREMRPGP
jgi:hypothetical protein